MNTSTTRASSSSKHEPVKPGSEIVRWKVWTLVDNSRPPHALLHLLRRIALFRFAGTFPQRERCSRAKRYVFRRSSQNCWNSSQRHDLRLSTHTPPLALPHRVAPFRLRPTVEHVRPARSFLRKRQFFGQWSFPTSAAPRSMSVSFESESRTPCPSARNQARESLAYRTARSMAHALLHSIP